jgi:probable phosphoglycerate mutase
MKETFYLVRHGQKAGGVNPPLSELGVRQAQAAAEFLTSFPIQSIIVSPLLRTRQTAEYIRWG